MSRCGCRLCWCVCSCCSRSLLVLVLTAHYLEPSPSGSMEIFSVAGTTCASSAASKNVLRFRLPCIFLLCVDVATAEFGFSRAVLWWCQPVLPMRNTALWQNRYVLGRSKLHCCAWKFIVGVSTVEAFTIHMKDRIRPEHTKSFVIRPFCCRVICCSGILLYLELAQKNICSQEIW